MDTKFELLLAEAGMILEKPDFLEEAPVVENELMDYDYALKYPDMNFEIRYAIRPLKKTIEEYEVIKKSNEFTVLLHPDTYFEGQFLGVMDTITGGEFTSITEFGREEVKKEFNADRGQTCAGMAYAEFAQEKGYCVAVALHKDGTADACIFFLSDEETGFNERMFAVFHCLRFEG